MSDLEPGKFPHPCHGGGAPHRDDFGPGAIVGIDPVGFRPIGWVVPPSKQIHGGLREIAGAAGLESQTAPELDLDIILSIVLV